MIYCCVPFILTMGTLYLIYQYSIIPVPSMSLIVVGGAAYMKGTVGAAEDNPSVQDAQPRQSPFHDDVAAVFAASLPI